MAFIFHRNVRSKNGRLDYRMANCGSQSLDSHPHTETRQPARRSKMARAAERARALQIHVDEETSLFALIA